MQDRGYEFTSSLRPTYSIMTRATSILHSYEIPCLIVRMFWTTSTSPVFQKSRFLHSILRARIILASVSVFTGRQPARNNHLDSMVQSYRNFDQQCLPMYGLTITITPIERCLQPTSDSAALSKTRYDQLHSQFLVDDTWFPEVHPKHSQSRFLSIYSLHPS
jgi:hypothetical protein